MSNVPVAVAEKDREFVPVGVKSETSNHPDLETTANTKASPTGAKGTVNVSSNPPGADVMLDGNFVGNTPASLKIAGGKHTVTVKMSGEKDWSRDITVEEGSEVQLAATLEKAP